MKVQQSSLGPISAPYDYMAYCAHQRQFTESPAAPLRWIHGVQESRLPPQAAPTSNPVEGANGRFVAGFPVLENCRPLTVFPQGAPSMANTFGSQRRPHTHAPTVDPSEHAAYLAPVNSQVAAVDVRSSFPAQESGCVLPPTPPAESLPNHYEPTTNHVEAATDVPSNNSFVHTLCPSAVPPAAVGTSFTSTAAGGSCSWKGTAKRVSSRKKTPPFQELDQLTFKAVKNAIERRRVGTINDGFKKLLNLLPTRYRAKRPTKLGILNGACQCIEQLQEALAKASKDTGDTAAQPINKAPVAEPRQPMDHRRWANQENVNQSRHQGSTNCVYAQNPPSYGA